jgi:hypothetical protein
MAPEDRDFVEHLLARHQSVILDAVNKRPRWRDWIAPSIAILGTVAALTTWVFKTNLEAAAEHAALDVADVRLEGRVQALEKGTADVATGGLRE